MISQTIMPEEGPTQEESYKTSRNSTVAEIKAEETTEEDLFQLRFVIEMAVCVVFRTNRTITNFSSRLGNGSEVSCW